MVCRVRAYVTQYVGRDRGTGGVGGRRDHHRACALAPVLPDERLIEVEARRRGRGHVDHLAAEGPHQLAVRRVRRVCDDHLVALVDAQCGRQQQCRRTSFGDHDAFRIDFDVMRRPVEPRDRLTEFRQSHGIRVRQWTAVIQVAHRLTHWFRRTVIGLPQTEVDHIDTLRAQTLRLIADSHAHERPGQCRAFRKRRPHVLPLRILRLFVCTCHMTLLRPELLTVAQYLPFRRRFQPLPLRAHPESAMPAIAGARHATAVPARIPIRRSPASPWPAAARAGLRRARGCA